MRAIIMKKAQVVKILLDNGYKSELSPEELEQKHTMAQLKQLVKQCADVTHSGSDIEDKYTEALKAAGAIKGAQVNNAIMDTLRSVVSFDSLCRDLMTPLLMIEAGLVTGHDRLEAAKPVQQVAIDIASLHKDSDERNQYLSKFRQGLARALKVFNDKAKEAGHAPIVGKRVAVKATDKGKAYNVSFAAKKATSDTSKADGKTVSGEVIEIAIPDGESMDDAMARILTALGAQSEHFKDADGKALSHIQIATALFEYAESNV